MTKVYVLKTGQVIEDEKKAKEEFIRLLRLANEYLKEAEELQRKYNLKL